MLTVWCLLILSSLLSPFAFPEISNMKHSLFVIIFGLVCLFSAAPVECRWWARLGDSLKKLLKCPRRGTTCWFSKTPVERVIERTPPLSIHQFETLSKTAGSSSGGSHHFDDAFTTPTTPEQAEKLIHDIRDGPSVVGSQTPHHFDDSFITPATPEQVESFVEEVRSEVVVPVEPSIIREGKPTAAAKSSTDPSITAATPEQIDRLYESIRSAESSSTKHVE